MGVTAVTPAEFPTLRGGIAYLDSSATSQTPQHVIDAMTRYYADYRASVHRGIYPIAAEATDEFESARRRAAEWLGWDAQTTVFTPNATGAINLVARGTVSEGDLVVLTEMEHHSNIVPWQLAGARLEYVRVDDEGQLDLDHMDELLARGPKVVSVVHVSNVLGTINPVEEIVRRARAAGAISVIDGAQAVPQLPVDVGAIDADFYAWTAHKAYGPTGIGVLHGRRELLEEMPPLIGGGHMIKRVDPDSSTWTDLPWKFEAGTSAVAEAIGLGAAVDWLSAMGMESVRSHEGVITAYALERLGAIDGIKLHGPPDAERRGALVSFEFAGLHPHDVAEILGRDGVCIRAGHHCAQPLMRRLGVTATSRASFAIHTTTEDVDRLVDGLERVRSVFA
ncbi:MAG TPA: SufS family cysteine desulfurase [Thermoleophilaceae bacterium]|nr:SufS family cysteine desulfurase [Thermoleophilaceae bacterium]